MTKGDGFRAGAVGLLKGWFGPEDPDIDGAVRELTELLIEHRADVARLIVDAAIREGGIDAGAEVVEAAKDVLRAAKRKPFARTEAQKVRHRVYMAAYMKQVYGPRKRAERAAAQQETEA